MTLKEHNVLEYVEGEVVEPKKNSNAAINTWYKKGEVKAKKIIIDSIGDHLITYEPNLKKYKEMYDTIIWMY